MDNYKEKLLEAVQDGLLDGSEVVEKLLEYLDEDQVMELVEGEGWDIGIRKFEEYGDEE
jgi:hypothetical protein